MQKLEISILVRFRSLAGWQPAFFVLFSSGVLRNPYIDLLAVTRKKCLILGDTRMFFVTLNVALWHGVFLGGEGKS